MTDVTTGDFVVLDPESRFFDEYLPELGTDSLRVYRVRYEYSPWVSGEVCEYQLWRGFWRAEAFRKVTDE
jgi:hypothetical protein